MTEIPEDVMKAAREDVMQLLGWESPDGVRRIARAIMAERERWQRERFEELQAAYRRGVDFACEGAGVNDEDYTELWRYVPKAAYDYADKATGGGL